MATDPKWRRQVEAQDKLRAAVASYIKNDVQPIAQSLILDQHFLRNHLSDQELRAYYSGLTRLGGALNGMPDFFLIELMQDRPGSAQSEIRGSLSELRPIVAKLPGASTYLKRMDDLMNATTVERIGNESELSEEREEQR